MSQLIIQLVKIRRIKCSVVQLNSRSFQTIRRATAVNNADVATLIRCFHLALIYVPPSLDWITLLIKLTFVSTDSFHPYVVIKNQLLTKSNLRRQFERFMTRLWEQVAEQVENLPVKLSGSDPDKCKLIFQNPICYLKLAKYSSKTFFQWIPKYTVAGIS